MAVKQLAIIVGQTIAEQRKARELTQAEIAEHLKIEVETVSRLETGAIAPTLKRLEQLSELFNCPIATFFDKANVSLSEQALTIAQIISPLSKEERLLIIEIVKNVVKIAKVQTNASD